VSKYVEYVQHYSPTVEKLHPTGSKIMHPPGLKINGEVSAAIFLATAYNYRYSVPLWPHVTLTFDAMTQS